MKTVCLALFLTLLAGAALAQTQDGIYTRGYEAGQQTPYVPATPPID